jgi:membrane protein implicated in regulation of membrane protease activity
MAATAKAPVRPSATGTDLTHAGAGLALAVIQLSAIIPGFGAGLVLTVALAAVVVVPLMLLGLLLALLAAPPYALWRLAARRRQRRSEPSSTFATGPSRGPLQHRDPLHPRASA